MASGTAGEITQLLRRWQEGDTQAFERLLARLYPDLRRVARRRMRREACGLTLDTHDLLHESFLRLLAQRRVDWHNRAHFFAVAARVMRRVLVDHARRRSRRKRGGGLAHRPADETLALSAAPQVDLLALEDALDGLERAEAGLARIVELRFYGGLGYDEIADLLGTSNATVRRRWGLARAWLYDRLAGPIHGQA